MIDSKHQSEISTRLLAQEISPAQWDDYLSDHPHGHHEQSSGFAKMRARHGFRSVRIGVFDEEGHIAAGAQLLYRSFPGAGRLAIVPQGPLVTDERVDAAQTLVESLEKLANKYRLSRIRVVNYTANEFWSPLLAKAGFGSTRHWWTAENIALVRCDGDDNTILSRMKSKCRYNLRVALRKGVKVSVGARDDIDVFHQLLGHTAKRQDFPIFPVDYLRYVWSLFAASNKARLFIASADGEPLAGVIATVAGDRVYYGWGGLSPKHPNLMANYVTHWEAIRWARSIGKTYYDLGGGGGGVERFKGQWGGELSHYPDPMDKFFGRFASLRQRASSQIWQDERLRKLARSVSYRYHGRMPY